MEKKETAPPEREMPYGSALMKVVTGLQDDPVLLYGIGAGIIIVGVLVFTASAVVVLIVAALFVVVLFARAHQDAQRLQKQGTAVKVSLAGSSVEDSNVGNIAQAGGDVNVRAGLFGSRIKGSNVGNVGPVEPRKKPEN